jgi:hypothetical protein
MVGDLSAEFILADIVISTQTSTECGWSPVDTTGDHKLSFQSLEVLLKPTGALWMPLAISESHRGLKLAVHRGNKVILYYNLKSHWQYFVCSMSDQRRFREKIGSFAHPSRILSRPPITGTPTVLDPSLQNPAPNAEHGLKVLSPANDSYRPVIPEALTAHNDGNPHSTGNRLKAMGATGWNTLKTALSGVNGASGAFPPLQAAVGGLLGVMTQIDVRVFTSQQCLP